MNLATLRAGFATALARRHLAPPSSLNVGQEGWRAERAADQFAVAQARESRVLRPGRQKIGEARRARSSDGLTATTRSPRAAIAYTYDQTASGSYPIGHLRTVTDAFGSLQRL